ncbi:hypothetical protein BDZ97DRAFT_1761389 [Flammula alnicola]|nr:hypothetical protein BDZ97DRAFT_1761389 [Flammula alnicola]
MDNPQHYQPLSHALHPPSSSLNRGHSNNFQSTSHHTTYAAPQKTSTTQPNIQQEEEEEEEEDDDDEGLVEEQLNQNDDIHGSDHASPKLSSSADVQAANHLPSQSEPTSPAPEQKRRPGRPRGSKNRRPRVGSAKHETQFYYQTPAPGAAAPTTPTATAAPTAPPQHANISPQNQQYYEFQWRVLNLCAEFYGAAEELVKGTSSLVVAQCYNMGPGVKIDPLVMLAEAKRVCDALRYLQLANPSQLVTNPPPPIYPVLPTLYQNVTQPAAAPIASTSTTTPTPTATVTNPPSVITNAQSFVVPLGAQPAYPQYPVYAAAHGQYPTTPYYQYAAYGQPGTYYAQPPQPVPTPAAQPAVQPAPNTSVTPPTVLPTATITTTPATGGTVIGNQGAWSDEETERLKKVAEESRSKGPSGDIEWDWVIQEWGISRTRHQILIKATAMGLKESSTRGIKRRRGDEEPSNVPPPMASLQQPSTSMASTSSPSQSASHATSTPAASPALQNQQRPSSSKGPGPLNPTTASKLPWPMPTVAVNAPSPVLSTPSNALDQQRSSYYRPRPTQDASGKQASMPQQQWYTPNGQLTSGMRPKENGK